MVFGNTTEESSYAFLPENLLKCFAFAKENDLLHFEHGSYEIEGDNIFVNIVSYETKQEEERIWEAHKKYLDVHLMLQGQEHIYMNFIDSMKQGDYVEKDDFVPLEGCKNGMVTLQKNDFLVCNLKDGHKTGVAVGQSEPIKKAIFKVRVV